MNLDIPRTKLRFRIYERFPSIYNLTITYRYDTNRAYTPIVGVCRLNINGFKVRHLVTLND